MNPLTLVKRIQKINSAEASLGISDDASWHAKYKDSAYVFVGGIPYDLTEGDLLAVFSQYGEIVDVNLVRDKATGKSKGFAFLAYEDQRSTTLAVDNLNGANVLGRIVRVDHVSNYKKKEEEDEEAEQQKREARGVCYAFQKGECTRGASCKFSHDERRNANTGWGAKDESSAKNESSARWGHDKYDGRLRSNEKTNQASAGGTNGVKIEDREFNSRSTDRDEHRSRIHGDERNNYQKDDKRESKKQSERYEKENWDRQRGRRDKEDREIRDVEKQLDVYEGEGRDRGAGKHDGGTKRKDRDRREGGLSEEYEKEGLDIADEKDESDINSDRREKGRYLRHNGDERRSGQRDRDLHESRKHSRYEDSTPYRRSEEDRSLHRRECRH